MLPAGQDAAEAFYRITDAAYERRFVAVTSKIPPGFDSIMPKSLAIATVVDWLLHRATWYHRGRFAPARRGPHGQGVIPLAI
jgi:hypothetical protein